MNLKGKKVVVAVFAQALLLSACSGAGHKLEDAVFDIPVYEPSTLDSQMGSTSGGDGFVVSGMGWRFTTSDKAEKILAWYKKKLPSAEKVTDDDGQTILTFKPKGAEEHEMVQIYIPKEGGFSIHEDVLPGKRK